jgi:hypothetical protein
MAVLGFGSAGMLSRRPTRGKRVLPNAARPLLKITGKNTWATLQEACDRQTARRRLDTLELRRSL